MYNYDRDIIVSSINPIKAIGRRVQLIPRHVIKIIYREGEGKFPQKDATVFCFFSCSLVDGSQLVKKRPQPKRLPVGSGRLIQGFQIALLTVRKNQIFTLIVSPEYAYKNVNIDNEKIPKDEKLIFDFEILDVQYLRFWQKQQTQVLFHIKDLYDKADKSFNQKKYNQVLQTLVFIQSLLPSTRFFKNDINVALNMKIVYMLCYLGKYQQALPICEKAIYAEPSNYKILMIMYKICKILKKYDLCKQYLSKCNDIYGENNLKIRRTYVEFLKSINDYYSLRNLPGYNNITDKVFQVPMSKIQYFFD